MPTYEGGEPGPGEALHEAGGGGARRSQMEEAASFWAFIALDSPRWGWAPISTLL